MFYINGSDIRIPCGDTAVIKFTFLNDGEPYFFGDGEFARLDVTDTDTGEVVIEKDVDIQDEEGSAAFAFSSADTSARKGTYVYTLKLMNANGGSVDTVQGFPVKSAFTIG